MMADPSVKNQKLKPGTVRRIATFAKPYRWQIVFFLITVVVDAFLVIATPLLLRELLDKGVRFHNGPLVTRLAIYVGLLAIADSLMSIVGRSCCAPARPAGLHHGDDDHRPRLPGARSTWP